MLRARFLALAAAAAAVPACDSILGDYTLLSGSGSDGGASDGASPQDTSTSPDGQGGDDSSTPMDGSGPADSMLAETGPADTGVDALTCAAPKTSCTVSGVATCVNTQTNATNCGTCGHACPGTATCAGGYCQPVDVTLAQLTNVVALACDSHNVYWVNNAGTGTTNAVYQVALTGGTAIQLSPSSPTGSALTVGVTGNTVAYIINWGGEQAQFFKAAVGAAQSGAELGVIDYGKSTYAMANLGTQFWALVQNNTAGYDLADMTTSSASGNSDIAGAAGTVGHTMASASNSAFWTDSQNGNVQFYTTSNPNMMMGKIASTEPGANNLTTDGTYLFWIDGPAASSVIRKAAATPTPQTPSTVVAVGSTTLGGIADLASDGTNLYWADNQANLDGVVTMPIAGGTPALLAHAATSSTPSWVSVCGTSLVWIEQPGTSEVLRIAALP